MATVKKEKGVTLNSRGTYEVRLGGTYYGSRKTLKEANALSLETQNDLAIEYLKPKKKQSVVTGRKNKTTAVKKPCPCENISTPKVASPEKGRYVDATEMVKRIETMPKKKSFLQFLKDMFK